jgi:hypothetical protein
VQDLDAPDKVKNTLFTNQVTGNCSCISCILAIHGDNYGVFSFHHAHQSHMHLFRAQVIFPGLKLNYASSSGHDARKRGKFVIRLNLARLRMSAA